MMFRSRINFGRNKFPVGDGCYSFLLEAALALALLASAELSDDDEQRATRHVPERRKQLEDLRNAEEKQETRIRRTALVHHLER